MSNFLTSLDVVLVDYNAASGRGLWELQSPLIYNSQIADLVITVPTGFKTDFASVPRVPIAFLLLGDSASAPAALHDFLYSTGILSRTLSDAVFREAALATGVPLWRANLLWAGVRLWGGGRYGAQYATN